MLEQLMMANGITDLHRKTGAQRQREHMARKKAGEPRRPTRVKSGTAMSAAELQRRYRARKAQWNQSAELKQTMSSASTRTAEEAAQ